jgi:hypothetical protein
MPDPADTRIVVNSYILGDLAAQINEESSGQKLTTAALLSVIRKRKHVICITDNIKKEYAKSESSGQYLELRGLLTPAILQLEDMGLAKQCGTGPMLGSQTFAGFRKQHLAFVEDAVRTDARYLLTVNSRWLARGAVGTVLIVSSARYVELQQG